MLSEYAAAWASLPRKETVEESVNRVESETKKLEKRRDEMSRQEALNILRDHYLSWMAESNINKMIAEYHRKHFGVGAFLFYFGAALLAHVVFHIILSVLPKFLNL